MMPKGAPNPDLLEDFKERIAEFCGARDWDQFHDAKELAIGLVTESSELLDLFRFKSVAEVEEMFLHPHSREKIEDEVADVLFFLLRLSGRYGIDLRTALEFKIQKNAAKYPVELSRGSNRKYNEF